jgi:glycosyltransferase involved in cell wall biosynthesis
MRIVHVNLANSLGGGEYQTLALMEALRGDCEQWLIHRRDAPLAKLARQQSLNTMSAGKALFSPFAACWRKPAVLHAHDGRGVHWARICARVHGLPYLITRRILKPPRQHRWTQSAYAGAFRIACVSQAVADSLYNYNAKLNCSVVYDGLVGFGSDEKYVAALRESQRGRLVIAQVGRLAAGKEVRVTLEVARRLADKNLPLHFWIVGDGPLYDSLQAAAFNIGNVEFLGHRSNVGDYLEAADVLMHPSRDEAFGSVIAEAMQHGTAVIASRVGGIPELVLDRHTGLLVNCGDVDGFTAALEQLYADSQLRAEFASAGRQRAESFSLQKMVESYLEMYQKCISDRPGKSI